MLHLQLKRSAVACNVYVSAGLPQYADVLMRLLLETQDQCCRINSRMRQEKNHAVIMLVHAFSDGPYDRSSFHIAGTPHLVADVASRLAKNAIQTLEQEKLTSLCDMSGGVTAHPTVGLVDHVSVLPLPGTDKHHDQGGINQNFGLVASTTSETGKVARQIGDALEVLGVDVLYYGNAHPSQKPLADVRRESTQFFNTSNTHKQDKGKATVGAPEFFTENYNIRLRPGTPKKIAHSLTKHVRERDGGLRFVEALTLPYSQERYEVACNLLNTDVTSMRDIEARLKTWEHAAGDWIETSYRVGTTVQMNLDALAGAQTKMGEESYNQLVRERFHSRIME
mmetsp:Transcript_16825/g.31155  ORF Transcript_16825/g.31155 Transcript_16825/m.31155 type:complete len:338 (+) Transcript_16825:66-1079(+)